MWYLKFNLVVLDLKFLHHLDLYQVIETLLTLTFTMFFLFTVFTKLVNFEEITISSQVEKFFFGGDLVFSET